MCYTIVIKYLGGFFMASKKDTLVNRERYSSTFDKDLLQEFKKLSDETSIPVSKLFDKALELVLKEYGKK